MVASDIKPGARLRHVSCSDIDFIVSEYEKIYNLGTNIRCVVKYYNKHWKIYQGQAEEVRIRKDQLHLWEIIDEET